MAHLQNAKATDNSPNAAPVVPVLTCSNLIKSVPPIPVEVPAELIKFVEGKLDIEVVVGEGFDAPVAW